MATTPSLARTATRVFESIGLLNKGSAEAARPTGEQPVPAQPLQSPALNVTRVGGFGAAIAVAGAAALTLYNVDKTKDASAVVVAAYLGTAAIVVSALLAAAIMVSADIRGRAQAVASSVPAGSSGSDATDGSSPHAFVAQWRQAIDRLSNALSGLKTGELMPIAAWLDAAASGGAIQGLVAPKGYADEHAMLAAGQTRILDRLNKLMSAGDMSLDESVLSESEQIIVEMRRTIANIPS